MKFFDKIIDRVARRAAFSALQFLKQQDRAALLEASTEDMIRVIRVGSTKITLYAPFPGLIFRADTLLTKEADTIAWIDGFKEGQVFWDIGANVGVYSLYAAITRQLRVCAFEPSSANFYVLTRNSQLNDLGERLNAYCVAFAGTTRLGVINLASHSMGAGSNQFGKRGEGSRYAGPNDLMVSHGMLGFTIDEFIQRFDPAFPNHIKMDVDGLEFDILSGAAAALRDPRLESILVELSLTEREETESAKVILREAGFEFVSRGEIQGVEPNVGANHIFRRVSPKVERSVSI